MALLYNCTIFIAFLILVVYPVGRLAFNLFYISNPSFFARILISIIIGSLLITIEVYILGLLNLYNLRVIMLLLQGVLITAFLLRKVFQNKISVFKVNSSDILVFIIVLFVTGINSSLTLPFGVLGAEGVFLPGAHSVDNVWHLSLVHALLDSVPPNNPLFAGIPLKNYHYLVDLQIATIHTITKIPLPQLYFQMIGPFYFLMYSSVSYLLGKFLTKNKFFGIIFMLLTSLSSNYFYLVNILYPSSFKWPSVAWVDYYSSKAVNYPLLYSMILLMVIFYLLLNLKKITAAIVIFLSVIIGSLMSIKTHTAIVLIFSVGSIAFFELIFLRRFFYLCLFLGSSLIGAYWLFSITGNGNRSLLFEPFWFIKTMYEASDRLNMPVWELKRQFFLSNKNYLHVARLYIEALFIFTAVNLGLAIFGLVTVFKNLKSNPKKEIVWLSFFIVFWAFTLTMLFVYEGIAIITIQFFYSAILGSSLLLLLLLHSIYLRKKMLGVVLSLIIWFSLLPGVYFTLKAFHTNNSSSTSKGAIEAIQYLSTLTPGIVIIDPTFSTTSIVTAYSGQKSFYADEILLDTLSIDHKQRKSELESFFTCNDLKTKSNYLRDHNLRYVFTASLLSCIESNEIRKIFSNNEILIFEFVNVKQ